MYDFRVYSNHGRPIPAHFAASVWKLWNACVDKSPRPPNNSGRRKRFLSSWGKTMENCEGISGCYPWCFTEKRSLSEMTNLLAFFCYSTRNDEQAQALRFRGTQWQTRIIPAWGYILLKINMDIENPLVEDHFPWESISFCHFMVNFRWKTRGMFPIPKISNHRKH